VVYKRSWVIFNFLLGLLCAIGLYPLFYKLNKPADRWRSIALMAAVVLSRPLCLLWQSFYLEHGQNNTVLLIVISVIFDALSLLICVLLGNNRSRALVSASFVFSIITIAQIPVVYFIAVVVYPLINTPSLIEASAQFPQLYYCGLLFNNVIISVFCLFAARWLRETGLKQPVKLCAFFSLLFVLFALIVLVWWSDIVMVMSISFLASAFMGTLLLGILLLLFYLYTRLTIDNQTAGKEETECQASEYSQFIQHLSKRELEVVEAILAGNVSHKELSNALNISVNTVKTHLKHIYQTTGVSSIEFLSYLFRGYTPNHP